MFFFLCRVIEVAFFKAVSKISLSLVTKKKLLHSNSSSFDLDFYLSYQRECDVREKSDSI